MARQWGEGRISPKFSGGHQGGPPSFSLLPICLFLEWPFDFFSLPWLLKTNLLPYTTLDEVVQVDKNWLTHSVPNLPGQGLYLHFQCNELDWRWLLSPASPQGKGGVCVLEMSRELLLGQEGSALGEGALCEDLLLGTLSRQLPFLLSDGTCSRKVLSAKGR